MCVREYSDSDLFSKGKWILINERVVPFHCQTSNEYDFDGRRTIITTGNQGANISQRKNVR